MIKKKVYINFFWIYWGDYFMSEDNSGDKEYLDEYVWNDYHSGDSLEGILVDSLSNIGEFGSRLYKIRADDGFYAVWGSSDLNKKMDKLNVGIGMNIRITYNGLVRTSNGFDMKDFTVEVLD